MGSCVPATLASLFGILLDSTWSDGLFYVRCFRPVHHLEGVEVVSFYVALKTELVLFEFSNDYGKTPPPSYVRRPWR